MSLLLLHCLVLWFSQQIKLDGERRNREYEKEIRRDKLVTQLIEEEQKRPQHYQVQWCFGSFCKSGQGVTAIYKENKSIKREQKLRSKNCSVELRLKWIQCTFGLRVHVDHLRFQLLLFFFFFSACMNSNRTIHAHEFTIQETKCTVHALFTHCLRDPQPFYSEKIYIKNEPHGTIHTFKNYFVIVFSVFSFQFLAK